MTRNGDTPKYVHRMQQELFDCLAETKSREELRNVEPNAQWIYWRYRDGLANVDARELAIHREGSHGAGYIAGVEDGDRLCVKGACTWEVETEREAAGFDAEYYGKLLEKAWEEVKFVFPPSCRR